MAFKFKLSLNKFSRNYEDLYNKCIILHIIIIHNYNDLIFLRTIVLYKEHE